MRPPAPRNFVVLLLQPEQDDRTMYLEFFDHEGISTLCAKDATHALSLAAKADVIVTGVHLPGPMDGIEFIIRLRNDASTKHVPVIVLTASAWITDQRRAEQAGCDLFLAKPCLPVDLLRHVREVVACAKLRHAGQSRS
jgi:CheY-like chemotaxis protein